MIKKHKFLLTGILACLVLMFISTFCFIAFKHNGASAASKKEIAEQELEKALNIDLNAKLPNGIRVGFSSNPYDYILYNDAYRKFVKNGYSMIDEIIEMQADTKRKSFDRYILAIAVEEILKVNLKDENGFEWDRDSVFTEKFKSFKIKSEKEIPEILDDNISNFSKIEKLKKFGKLSIGHLKNHNNTANSKELSDYLNELMKN